MNILTIQSHVAYGYVGNRAAVFTLQRLGFDPWVINTVQFSNHTGYGDWHGEVLPPEHIYDVFSGIKKRGVLNNCRALLTGYLGHPDTARTITQIHQELYSETDALWCCDPVMGDYGRGVFVHKGIPDYMCTEVIPKVDFLTPNQFELELITGVKIIDQETACLALNKVHEMGPRYVLLTSFVGSNYESPDSMRMMLSSEGQVWLTTTPFLNMQPMPNGAGDTVAALFLANMLQYQDAKIAIENTTAAIYAVLNNTMQAGTRELQLIQSQKELISPKKLFMASELLIENIQEVSKAIPNTLS